MTCYYTCHWLWRHCCTADMCFGITHILLWSNGAGLMPAQQAQSPPSRCNHTRMDRSGSCDTWQQFIQHYTTCTAENRHCLHLKYRSCTSTWLVSQDLEHQETSNMLTTPTQNRFDFGLKPCTLTCCCCGSPYGRVC